jgi:WD40 repeat protein
MSIRAACPKCGHTFKLADNLAGKKIRCTECEAIVPVPAADEDAAEGNRSRPSAKKSSSPADRGAEKEAPTRRKREETHEDKPRPVRATRGKGLSLWLVGAGVVLLLVMLGGGITGGILLIRNRAHTTEPIQAQNQAQLPTPIVEWTDKEADGTPAAGAKGLKIYYRGKLVRIVPLAEPIREKSLEVWCTIPNLDQRRALVLGIEDGDNWDGILLGELVAREWYPGSSYGHRSGSLGGRPETAAPTEVIHLVMVYATDGRITLYRNGQQHGSFLPTGANAGLRTFPAENTRFQIGANAEGKGAFQGDIVAARMYNRALLPSEVTAIFDAGKDRWKPSGGGDKPTPGGGTIDVAKLIRKWDIANAPGRRMEFQPGGVCKLLQMTDGVEKEVFATTYKVEGDTLTLTDEKASRQENFGKIKRLTDDECIILDPKGESIVLRRPGYEGGGLVANFQNQTDLHRFGIAYSNYVQGENNTPATIEDLAPYVENDARLVKAVRDGILILYWNVDVVKLTASSPSTVLGYEKDTPTKGGLVVLVNADTKLMTADEFKKATKPPSGGVNPPIKLPDFTELFSVESGFKNSEGKSTGATGIAISGDGKTAIVMASIDKGNVQVWDLENRKKLYQFDNKSGSMLPVAISPDGKLGAYATQQSPSIAIIDLTSGKELRQLRKKGNIPLYFFTTGLAFSPAGDLLIVASDKEILGWNPTTGEQRLAWTESEEITALSNFFDKGKKIASATAKGVKVWDVDLGKDVQKFDPALKDDKVKKLFVTEDGKRLGLQGFYDPFKILDTSNGTVLKEFRGSPGVFSSVRLLPDGHTILYNGDWDYVVQDTNTGKKREFGAIKDVRHYPVAVTNDGTKFVTSDETGRITVWSRKAR